MKCRAYAKVNLILKVVGKYDNGYHQLQMLNAKIDLYDEIEIKKNDKGIDSLYFVDDILDETKDNLVLKVLNEIKRMYNIKESFDIYIKKNIPIGAGLGGGSSDAAAVVTTILNIYNIEKTLEFEKLCKVLSRYGADIPYALIDRMAIVSGIGEEVKIIDNLYDKEFIIVNPDIFISTKDIFSNNKSFSEELTDIDIINLVKEKGHFAFYNDLEMSACNFCKELCELKKELAKFGHTVMSGSGSTFMVFTDACDVYEKIKHKYPRYLVKKVKIIKETNY